MVSKRVFLLSSVFAVLLLGAGVWAYAQCCGQPAAQPAAAPPPITSTGPFTVRDVTGPAAGQDLCYICRYGGRPSLVVFTRTTEGHFANVAAAVDKLVAANKQARLAGFVVLLGENNKANRERLAGLAREHKLTIPLTIAADGADGPKAYNLAEREFDTLVLATHRNRVRSTHRVVAKCGTCTSTCGNQIADITTAGRKLLEDI
jgi:hypothetical protein